LYKFFLFHNELGKKVEKDRKKSEMIN